MSFSKTVVLQIVILAVVLEADLGHKKISFFRVARPIVAAVAVVPAFVKAFPTNGNNLLLQGGGALLGIVLGLFSVSPAFVSARWEPEHLGPLAKRLHRAPKPAVVTYCAAGYAALWISIAALRLTFAYTSQHTFPVGLGVFLHNHQLSSDALTNALIFLPVGMDCFRSIGLSGRRSGAIHRSAGRAPSPATSRWRRAGGG